MSGILEKTKMYLCGPIEYAKDQNWRNYVSDILVKHKIIPYNPLDKPFVKEIPESEDIHKWLKQQRSEGNLTVIREFISAVRRYDLNLVDRCDSVIAFIDPSVPTFGTIEELIAAEKCLKPVFIAIKGGIKNTPYWLLAMFPEKCFFNSLDDIIERIIEIDNGTVPIDDKFWRLLKKELR